MPDKITRLPLNASAGASHRHLTEDDLRAIYSVLPENQPQLAALRQLIQQRGLTANTTLAEMEQHQGLFDRMEVFTLLGDRYPLTEQQVREGDAGQRHGELEALVKQLAWDIRHKPQVGEIGDHTLYPLTICR